MLKDHLIQHLQSLGEPRNPVLHGTAHARAADYIEAELRAMGREVRTHPFTVGALAGVNLSSPASMTDDPRFLIVAHYDTVDHSPGADDNGSAVAVALELARRHPEVAFLFPDLEERDLTGSRHWVKEGLWPNSLALVLESVGFWNPEPQSQSFPPLFSQGFPAHYRFLQDREFRGDFWALLYLDNTPDQQAQKLQSRLSHDVLAFELSAQLVEHFRDFGRSDHLAFWEAGRPCLMLTDTANFRNPHYHRPSDTAGTLNFEVMAELTGNLSEFLLS